ncbi:hypothetical protein MMC24_000188 [Lignoscripta atroalba]|nr:hypothetical protein [Lignoscripta atroalba]
MSAHAFGAFVKVDTSSQLADPPAVLDKNAHTTEPKPSNYELDQLIGGSYYNGPSQPQAPSDTQTPITPNDLEMDRPSSPRSRDAADIVQSLSNPPMNKWRLLSCCLMCFGNGLNDSAPGALIPYMEESYKIGYAIVSLIFVTNAIGFISAAPLTHPLEARLGRAKTLALALSFMVIGYAIIVSTPPFPVVVVAFFLTGLGMALNLALNNVFCANLVNPTTTLGAFHGSYGIGGTVGPLMATGLVSRGHQWSSFYFISLGVTILNLTFAYWAFRNYETDRPNPLLSALELQTSRPTVAAAAAAPTSSDQPAPSSTSHPSSKSKLLKQALRNKTTILGALFIFAYQGAEVSISGWVISFLISYRHSSPSRIGYVTAGFWAGITLGRFLLSHPCHRLGEKRSVFGLVIGATCFQFLVWFLPNVIGNAVAVSIVGLLLGPVYPCAMAVFSKLVGRKLQMSSLALVSAMGSSGGAAAPFFTGLLAQQVGTWVLHPICVGLFGAMLVCWGCLDRIGVKRRE